MGTTLVGHLYSRLIPLVLLLIDGNSPLVLDYPILWNKTKAQFLTSHIIVSGSNAIDITDPGWEILLLVQKKNEELGGNQLKLLGFAAIYRFYHYPDSLRLRLGQVCSPLH